MLPLVKKALEKETDAGHQAAARAGRGDDRDQERRQGGAPRRGRACSANRAARTARRCCSPRRRAEPDEDIRVAAQKSLRAVEGRLAWGERAGLLFAGISLGSILLLAALGLAITYGLMGVINMAHGELIMIGAYATYVVQNLFRAHAPAPSTGTCSCAVPAAFAGRRALVGMVLERAVIRWLYGRPLETLLATWGISLMLIQAVRTIFGAQNVQVENPAFMSGGIAGAVQRGAAVEPHRDHRLRAAGAGRDVRCC